MNFKSPRWWTATILRNHLSAISPEPLTDVDEIWCHNAYWLSKADRPFKFLHTHTHTHTHPFNGPFSGTTRVSRYQKGRTSLDFTEARDSEWQWHQLGHMQVCTSLQTDNHASTPPLLGQLSLASLRGRLIEYQLRLG